MKLDYWELSIPCDETKAEVLTAFLSEVDFESFIFEDDVLKAYAQQNRVSENEMIQSAVEEVFSQLPFELTYTLTKIEQQNWNETWEKQFDPILIEDKCIVRAPFHSASEGIMNVLIEPKMSFGTGHHQTTYMMIRQLFDLDVQDKTVLDMGCGTAVLAIVAEKLNAKSIVAIDIEEWAYENSIENCALNGCNQVEIRLGGAEMIGSNSFDFILANINKNILKQDLHVYEKALHKSGKILLSGFFSTDVEELTSHAGKLQLNLEKVVQKDEWALLILSKK